MFLKQGILGALLSLNSREITKYWLLGTPWSHNERKARAIAARDATIVRFLSTQGIPISVLDGKTSEERRDAYKAYAESTRIAYAFIDRGVSRAQGLLQFNSLVLAALVLAPSLVLGNAAKIVYWGILVPLVPLVISTLLAGACLWLVWFREEHHEDPEGESLLVWNVWLNRSLLFNAALLMAGFSFVVMSMGLIVLYALHGAGRL